MPKNLCTYTCDTVTDGRTVPCSFKVPSDGVCPVNPPAPPPGLDCSGKYVLTCTEPIIEPPNNTKREAAGGAIGGAGGAVVGVVVVVLTVSNPVGWMFALGAGIGAAVGAVVGVVAGS